MRSIKQGSLVICALTVSLASTISGQARPAAPRQTATRQAAPAAPDMGFWELGTDMNLGIGINDPKSFFINIPTGLVRAGYYVSNVLSLEPSLAFNSFAQENSTAFSSWMLQIGALYHLSPDRRQSQLFIHPMIGFIGGSGGARTLTLLGAGIGIKEPVLANRLALRCEAGFNHRLKSGPVPSATSIVASLGWSVYTK